MDSVHLPGFLIQRKYNVSETMFPSSGEGRDTPNLDQWLRLALSKGLNRVRFSVPSPEDGNGSQFPKRCPFFVLRIPDDVQSPVILRSCIKNFPEQDSEGNI
jgi:hypothetical protein